MRVPHLLVDCGATSMTAVRGPRPRVRWAGRGGAFRVTPFEVRHASGARAYAVRVDGPDGSLAYSGDTEWTEALVAAADGVDLFLCEGYRPTPVKWHLDLETLAAHRDRLTCRRVVLTHLSPAALDADLGGWEVAHDGMVLIASRG